MTTSNAVKKPDSYKGYLTDFFFFLTCSETHNIELTVRLGISLVGEVFAAHKDLNSTSQAPM